MQQEPCTHMHRVQLKLRKVSAKFMTYSCQCFRDHITHLPTTAGSSVGCLLEQGSKPPHRREVIHSGKSVWLENSVCVAESTGKHKQPSIGGLENTTRVKAGTFMLPPALGICQEPSSKTRSKGTSTQATPGSELILLGPGPLCHTVPQLEPAQLNIPCLSRPKEEGA